MNWTRLSWRTMRGEGQWDSGSAGESEIGKGGGGNSSGSCIPLAHQAILGAASGGTKQELIRGAVETKETDLAESLTWGGKWRRSETTGNYGSNGNWNINTHNGTLSKQSQRQHSFTDLSGHHRWGAKNKFHWPDILFINCYCFNGQFTAAGTGYLFVHWAQFDKSMKMQSCTVCPLCGETRVECWIISLDKRHADLFLSHSLVWTCQRLTVLSTPRSQLRNPLPANVFIADKVV